MPSEQQNQKLKAVKELNARNRATSLKAILSHREGRDLMFWILDQGSVFGETFAYDADGRGDALVSAFNQGARNYGNKIFQEIMRVDPDAYITMIKENRPTAVEEENDDSSD